MRTLITTLTLITLAGCADAEKPPQYVGPDYGTKECNYYHAMSTAPMAPSAVKELKLACDKSREAKGG